MSEKKDLINKKEEKEILNAFKAGKLKTSSSVKEDMNTAGLYAKNTLSKTKQISIRLPEQDLQKLKIKAVENGIPYQTIIGALI